MKDNQPRRQFSLRELFAQVLIVALAIGWWLDHRRALAAVQEWELRCMSHMQTVKELQVEKRELQEQNQLLIKHMLSEPEGDNEP